METAEGQMQVLIVMADLGRQDDEGGYQPESVASSDEIGRQESGIGRQKKIGRQMVVKPLPEMETTKTPIPQSLAKSALTLVEMSGFEPLTPYMRILRRSRICLILRTKLPFEWAGVGKK
jgi:hypothetical protein